jgi:hypothetical protein
MNRRHALAAAAMAATVLLVALPAAADWLVTRDGARLETEGSWELRGKLVVFTADGRLSSLSLDEVDLEASRELTAQQAQESQVPPEAAEPPAEPKPKAVMVITEKDLPPRRRPAGAETPSSGQTPPEGGAGGQQAITTPRSVLTVPEWQITDESTEGIVLAGRLANPTEDAATAISLGVMLFDDLGKEVGRRYASLETEALAPGSTTGWSVVFPGIYTFTSVRFEPEAIRLRSTPEPAAAGEEGGNQEAAGGAR